MLVTRGDSGILLPPTGQLCNYNKSSLALNPVFDHKLIHKFTHSWPVAGAHVCTFCFTLVCSSTSNVINQCLYVLDKADQPIIILILVDFMICKSVNLFRT